MNKETVEAIEAIGLSGEYDLECPKCGAGFTVGIYGELDAREEREVRCGACGAYYTLRLSAERGMEVVG